MKMINKTKIYLGLKFGMKEMGEASYVLRIKIIRDQASRLLYLDQFKYIKNVLRRFKNGEL